LLTLGVLTFLLIFASIWIAFYVARGLTAPIKALAIGADEIARGNLGHRVEVLAEDELAKLVAAFNVMSAKLEENQGEITERRRYIETLIAALPTGVLSFDENNKLTTINRSAETMLGSVSGESNGKTPEEIFPTENAVAIERLLNRAKRAGTATDHATLQRVADGEASEFNVAMTASRLPDDAGTVLVIEDLSELIAAQRAAAWQEVARRMAHEIKNPLTPIQLSAERIAKRFNASGHAENGVGKRIDDKGPIGDVVAESTATIIREVESLKMMVDEFSRFARLPDTVLSPGDLGEVIELSVASFDGKFAGVDITYNANGSLPETLIDAEQLKRVFVNLIENAGEALTESSTGGTVTITARHDTAREIIVAEVADNGPGIQQRDLQKLFQPYFSTKGRGTGLGLAIVHRIISEHKGRIFAVANQPNGAKFIIELPVAS
jgi:PAS domain S-box-containing protein